MNRPDIYIPYLTLASVRKRPQWVLHQADQRAMNISQETVARLAAIMAAVSAVAAVIGAVVASRSAVAAMKAAEAAVMSEQAKCGGRLPPPITITMTKKTDSARNFIGAINTPLGTLLTILFSIAFGVGLNLLLSQSTPPSSLVLASKPAAPASMASVSASPPPTTTAAAPDHSEVAGLLARGRAYLSDGDVALARVLLRRAAERDEPEAALALGGTYDPAELRRLGIPNFQAQADPSKAREWYRRAADLGSAAAVLRLERLP
jgi:TPR repeat protein